MTTIAAHFDGKTFVPDAPVTGLRPGDRVTVMPERATEVLEGTSEPDPDGGDPLVRMLDLAVETGICDLARNLDHYLYGHPKIDEPGEPRDER